MRKSLYFIGLGLFFVSCGTQKKVQSTTTNQPKPSTQVAAKPVEAAKPKITTEHGANFFTENFAKPGSNDNTASLGSIVTAKPTGYKVTNNYFPSIAQNFRQKYLILHYTALNNDKSIMVLTQQAVSVHYLVNDLPDNEIYQLVDENKRAYHAGISHWRTDNMLNDTSIGIEIVNLGDTPAANGMVAFADFPDYQFRKVAALAKDIVARYGIPPYNVLAHADIAPKRKPDPGPKFPWKRLYDEYQIGMWYDAPTVQNFLSQMPSDTFTTQSATPQFIFQAQSAFQKFGYDINPTGSWDKDSKRVVQTFQYHFRPEKYDGVLDAETWAILQALMQKYPAK